MARVFFLFSGSLCPLAASDWVIVEDSSPGGPGVYVLPLWGAAAACEVGRQGAGHNYEYGHSSWCGPLLKGASQR